MVNNPTVVLNRKNIIGEGILWHPDEKCLYWIDIPASKIFQHKPSSGATKEWETGSPVGGFTIHEDGRLLLFMYQGAIKLWMDGDFETVIESLPEMKGNRFNDVVADPMGRVFCGVMSTDRNKGWVYQMDSNKRLTRVIENTGTANGMGFNNDETQLFFCDSKKSDVSVFDYDKETGKISNQRRIFQTLRSTSGSPDGLCVDSDDNLWIGLWEGSSIVQIDQEGVELKKIEFPTRKITTLCFAGEDLSDMYINSAGAEDLDLNGQSAGALFHLRLGIKGKYEYRSRFD